MPILNVKGEKITAKQKAQEIYHRMVSHMQAEWDKYDPMTSQLKGNQSAEVQVQVKKIGERIQKILGYNEK